MSQRKQTVTRELFSLVDIISHLWVSFSSLATVQLLLTTLGYNPASDTGVDLLVLSIWRYIALRGFPLKWWRRISVASVLVVGFKSAVRLLDIFAEGDDTKFYFFCASSAIIGILPVCLPPLLFPSRSPPSIPRGPDGDPVHWTRLFVFAKSHWKLLASGCVVLFVRLPFSIAIPHFVSEGIGALLYRDVDRLKSAVGGVLVCGTIDALLDFWCVFLFAVCQQRIVLDLRSNLFRSMLRYPLQFFDANACGELMSRLSADTGEMANDLSWVFRFSIEAVVRICGVAGYMIFCSWRLALLIMIVVPINSMANTYYGNWLRKNAKKCQDALAVATTSANESLSSASTVKAFHCEEKETNRYTNALKDVYKLQVRQAAMNSGYYMIISTFLMNTVVQAALVAYGGLLAWNGLMATERLVSFMLYRSQLQEWFSTLLNSYSNLLKCSGASERVFKILDDTNVENDAATTEVPQTGRSPPNIIFNAVSLRYPTRPEILVLDNVTFEIKSGDRVAIVGPSGSGKTSLVSLVLRLYKPISGEVSIGGVNVTSIPLSKLRGEIAAVVSQEPVLFRGTIAENVLYARRVAGGLGSDEDDAIVSHALDVSCARQFVEALPGGRECKIGDRGVTLSGGQKQRIAIARAVAVNPHILLLDEAMSALDASSEALVQKALSAAMQQRTTMIVSHRMSSVLEQANWVVVLHKGKVVEKGEPRALLSKNVEENQTVSFKILYDLQARGIQ